MEVQEIDIVIDKDGQVQIEVQGVKGLSCLDLTKELEEALGGEIEEREMRYESYETTKEFVETHQKQAL
jgi:hypothetical protein